MTGLRPAVLFGMCLASPLAAAQTLVTDIEFHWESHARRAPGSDNWPMTWADDGHQYTSWGDGGGFGGTNRDGRVSLGVARIEGGPDDYTGHNVFGGMAAERPATFDGKSYGLLSIDGTLYMWVMVEEQYFSAAELYYSTDRGASWSSAGWRFEDLDGAFSVPVLLNFGRDYAGARDQYVYLYAPGAKRPGFGSTDTVDLARVPADALTDRSAYEFFAGTGADGEPSWTADIERRRPVLTDRGDVHWTIGVSYNPGLDRYFLFNNCRGNRKQLGWKPTHLDVYEAPEPWGPWTRIRRFRKWGDIGYTFSYYLAPAWISADGRDFTLVFSGTGKNDSWNTVRGTFVTGEQRGGGAAGPWFLLVALALRQRRDRTRRGGGLIRRMNGLGSSAR